MSTSTEIPKGTAPSPPASDEKETNVNSASDSSKLSSSSSNHKQKDNQEQPKNHSSTDKTASSKDSSDSDDDGPLLQWMTGIKEDLSVRLPLYTDDWSRPKSIFTVVNATFFALVIQLIPALIFAELMDRTTQGNLATAETLLSSSIIGIIYAIFAGQPLVIMGITGPVAILLGTSYTLTEKFDADYFAFFFWICIWAGVMHMGSACIGLVRLVWKVTPFTSQIFELFIAVTFLYASVRDLIEPIYLGQDDGRPDKSAQYASLVLGLLTCYIAWTLHFCEQWAYFDRTTRTFLTSYNTMIAVVVVTAISFLPGMDLESNGVGGLDRVNVSFPWDWQPTAERAWITNPLTGIDAKGIFGAIIPGFMFFLLFIIDHNVSSILTQDAKFNLQKPPAYHWDFFVLGLTFIPCAILGLPPGNGLIPQAPLHCRALCTREFRKDEHGVTHEVVTHVEEQRWSGLGQALLMLVALSAFRVLSWIPRGALFGLFLYLGMGALHGNEIWERFLLNFMYAKRRPQIPIVRNVPWKTVQWWTAVQAMCALCIFAVAQFASVGYLYPALLTALVPLRSYVLSQCFDPEHLKYLDPFDTGDDTEDGGAPRTDYHQEQREYQLALLQAALQEDHSFDYADNDYRFSRFRGQGRNAMLHKKTANHQRRRHSWGHEDDGAPLPHITQEDTEKVLDTPVEDLMQQSLHSAGVGGGDKDV